MTLVTGARIGSYEILSTLGIGGMGEVYRARDTKLGRDVAIKILPAEFALDSERVARFEREAQILASLSHANIAAIYHVEESEGLSAIVLELVEGETLAERIARGPIPVDECLPIARQVCDSLEAAHEHSVIHRDLKPGNVKVRPDGTVKVLDFGLAKLVETRPEHGTPDHGRTGQVSHSPTMTAAMTTRAGTLLGTVAYMSPEQARGKAIDKRADIWAFGCVLFEMLSARPAFPGSDVSETLAAVIKSEPEWSALPAAVSPGLRALIRRCLQKDPRQRLRDIGDARIAIDELSASAESATKAPAKPSRRGLVGWIAASVLLASTISLAWIVSRPAEAPPLQKLSILPPDATAISSMAISPDGRRLAFSAASAGKVMLWIRALDSSNATPLPGTDGATFVFWSPDSRSIGFFAQGELKRVAATGGVVQTITDAQGVWGATWGQDGVILFVPGQFDTLYRVAATGGSPSRVTNFAKGETSHRYPSFLPDGRHFLFSSVVDGVDTTWVTVGAIDSPDTVRLTLVDANGSNAAVMHTADGDFLLFTRQQTLLAQRFNMQTMTLSGDPAPATEELITEYFAGSPRSAVFSGSTNGILAFRAGTAREERQMIWSNRAGTSLGHVGVPASYEHVELSPDLKRVAVDRRDLQSQKSDIWLIDIASETPTRFTFDPGQYDVPRWSPNGDRLLFPGVGNRKGVYQKLVTGAGGEEQVMPSPHDGLVIPDDWSPDGRSIVYVDVPPATSTRLWVLPMSGDRRAVEVPNTDAQGANGRFSPDGRWLAYQSSESGSPEVYVQPYPPSGAKWQISRDGGRKPRWRRDGKELYYIAADGTLMAVPVTMGAGLQPGTPARLFPIRYSSGLTAQYPYDVSPDGQKFLVIEPIADQRPTPVTVFLNWRPVTPN